MTGLARKAMHLLRRISRRVAVMGGVVNDWARPPTPMAVCGQARVFIARKDRRR